MEKENLLKVPYSLNIQLFADNGDNGNGAGGTTGGNDPQPETVSKEDFDRLKASFDKTSSELAKMKKEKNDKLSEEEKMKKEQEEKDQRLAELELRVLTGDMSSELLPIYGKDSTSKIIEAYKKGNMVELCKVISAETSNVLKTRETEWNQKFQQSSTKPPVGSGANDGIDSSVKKYVESKNNTSLEEQRKQFFNL